MKAFRRIGAVLVALVIVWCLQALLTNQHTQAAVVQALASPPDSFLGFGALVAGLMLSPLTGLILLWIIGFPLRANARRRQGS